MRQLTYKQARNCELAVGKVCRCRCRGLLHGALRGNVDDKQFFYELDDLDPHHLDSKEQRLIKKKEQYKLMSEIVHGSIKHVSAFTVLTLAADRIAILQCSFCKTVVKLVLEEVVDANRCNYKNGWLHHCPSSAKITTEYSTWKSMLIRCYNKDHPSYEKFGRLGIVVDNNWKTSFESFLLDLGLKPESECLLSRKDFSKDYDADNCIWICDKLIRKGVSPIVLHTLYKFNDEWYKFWIVEYDYDRPAKILRTEEYQAPMIVLSDDLSFKTISPAPASQVARWLEKFGEKFGYQNAMKIDNGTGEYLEQYLLPLSSSATNAL